GRVGPRFGYGGFAAAVRLEGLLREQREQVEDVVNDLRRRCLRGELKPLSGQDFIPQNAWIDLKIDFEADGAPIVRELSSRQPVHNNIRFSKVEALREFPRGKERDDSQDAAIYAQSLLHQRRKRVADWFNRRQERTAFGKRIWLALTEIVDEYARKPGSLAVDDKERERALDALRRSILAREFVDDRGRFCIINMHPS